MGLSFHYSGQLRKPGDENILTEEVADICRDLGWDFVLLQRQGRDAPLYGISVTPRGSEPLFLSFERNGQLLSPVQLGIGGDPQDPYYYTLHTKTQYAGTDTHMVLIKLLKYLHTKYFAHLEILDEGMYWETGDEGLLQSQFRKYNRGLETVITALSGMKNIPGESTGALALRLEQLLKQKLGGNE